MTNCNKVIPSNNNNYIQISDNGEIAMININGKIDISDLVDKYEIVRTNDIGSALILTIPIVNVKTGINL